MKPSTRLIALSAAGSAVIVSGGLVLGTGSSVAAPDKAKTKTITATEQEYSIKLSKTKVTPGKVTFIARNVGDENHTFMIKGPSVDKGTSEIRPGHSTRITVTVKKGSYDIYCAIPGHKMLGMNTHLKVS